MNHAEEQYLKLLAKILETGEERADRTGTGTISRFGEQIKHDWDHGFPLLTTKKLHWKSIAIELLWFLTGSSNIQMLKDNGVTIWDEWADENGNLGPIYGHQWKFWGAESWFDHQKLHDESKNAELFDRGIDQIEELIEGIKKNPFGRRHIVTAWNPEDINQQKLPPCHILFQMYVHTNGELSCHMFQRSCDAFLGLPYNIASYALLLELVANECELKPRSLTISFGDIHIYKNHIEQVKLQLTRSRVDLPTLYIQKPGSRVLNVKYEDLKIEGYTPHPAIKGEVSI